ncbi:hypothetical protein Q6348_08255, partial [Isoptericola sp. b441]
GARVAPTDPVARESFLVVLGEREVVALVAAPSVGEPELVDVVITQDPRRVHQLARSLFGRVPGPPDGAAEPPEARDDEADPRRGRLRR